MSHCGDLLWLQILHAHPTPAQAVHVLILQPQQIITAQHWAFKADMLIELKGQECLQGN